jgi:hypothetical protein
MHRQKPGWLFPTSRVDCSSESEIQGDPNAPLIETFSIILTIIDSPL